MNKYQVNSLEEFKTFVQEFAEGLQGFDKHLILLSGDLGTGKTEFVKNFVHSLGGKEVTSPSFAIINTYQAAKHNIDHIDLYRLESDDDLESTGFWDLFEKSRGFILVEWANRLEGDIWPPNWPKIQIEIKSTGEFSRDIFIS